MFPLGNIGELPLCFPFSFRDSADSENRKVRARVCEVLHAGANAETEISRTRETDPNSSRNHRISK